MKKLGIISLASLLLFSACGNAGKGEAIAEVNGKKITKQTYEDLLDVYSSFLISQYGLNNQVKNMLIQNEIIKQDLEKNKVEVTDKDFENSLNKTIESMGGREKFDEMLKKNNITEDQFKKTNENNTYYAKHQEWYNKNHVPKDEEIKKHYEENKSMFDKYFTSHILVKTKKEAEDIIKKLDGGEDFAKLAKEYSLDPGSKDNGGKYDAQVFKQFVPEYKNAAMELEVGKYSQPVKSSNGYHVIKLDDKKVGSDQAKEEIITFLNQQNYSKYVNELTKNAKIEDLTVEKPKEDPKKQAEDKKTSEDGKKDDKKTDDTKKENE